MPWYDYPIAEQKEILMLLHSAQNAMELWIGPIAPLNVESAMEVCVTYDLGCNDIFIELHFVSDNQKHLFNIDHDNEYVRIGCCYVIISIVCNVGI